MRKGIGASGLFYLILTLVLMTAAILAPYPHYDPAVHDWRMGVSTANRLFGQKDPAIPLDRLFSKVVTESVGSPFALECMTDTDCRNYTVTNQCRVYCGSTSAENDSVVTRLNNQRVCDHSVWRPPRISCSCVYGKCINLQ